MVVGAAEQGVRNGAIAVHDSTDAEIETAVFAHLAQVFGGQEPLQFQVQVDHGETLVSEALRFHEREKWNLAIVFYATHVEHWLNDMMLLGAERKGLAVKEARQMLREAAVPVKTGWLWLLLFGERMPADLVIRIGTLAQARNAFVHYKWDHFDADDDNAWDRSDLRALSGDGPDLVAALEAVEDHIIFADRRPLVVTSAHGWLNSLSTANQAAEGGP
jgi:hypothetical protein